MYVLLDYLLIVIFLIMFYFNILSFHFYFVISFLNL